MKRLIFIIIVLFISAVPALIYTQTMSDYCSAPPYVTRTVPPNITIVLDNSKSMLEPAYAGEYNPSSRGSFIGYFKADKSYCASSSQFYEASSCSGADKGPYPGSLLNWAAMSKYDIVMLVLIGGKGTPTPSSRDKLKGENADWNPKTTGAYPGCVFDVTNQGGLRITDAGGCSLPAITSSGGTSVTVSVNDYVPNVSPRGIIQGLVDKSGDGNWDNNTCRIGIMRFQASQNDIKMDYCAGVTGPMSSFLNGVASDQSKPSANDSSAPFGLAMLRAIQYFKNGCGTSCSPCGDPIDSVPCRKNFVLAIGSGEATDIPSLYSAGSLNEAIRLAHTSDIRSDINGTQVINFFNVHVFGNAAGGNIMKGFSKYGGFSDSNSNQQPDLQAEWDKDGDGLPNTYYESTDVSELQRVLNNAFQDILAQAASGTSVSVLTTSSRGVGSVIQAYFLPSRYEGIKEIGWTGYMQNIWIDPAENLREDTENDYRLVLDQDRVMKLFFDNDSNETKAALFSTDADGRGGTLSTCSGSEIKPFSNIMSVWEAGRKLALMNPSARTIFTSKKIIRGAAATVFTEMPYPEFKANMSATFLSALNPDETYTAEKIVRYIRGECLERSVQDDTNCGSTANSLFRDRTLTVDGSLRVWKLGDIISSTPKVFASTPLNTYHVDYADSTYLNYVSSSAYKQKSSVAFVGANDGMLHAFRVGYLKDSGLIGKIKAIFRNFFGSDDHDRLGEEVWAYVPFNAFPYLKYLADPNYCHMYYSDLSVRLVDVSTNGAAASTRTNAGSWQTILIGGMRFGGACGTGGTPADPPTGTPADTGFSSYFAIDVSDPEKPVPLWEFSDADMGYATTFPSVMRTGDGDKNGNWYVAFGAGPKVLPQGGRDIGRTTPGYIYILDLKTGSRVQKIQVESGTNNYHIIGDILAVDADKDYHSEKIYFGTSYYSSGWKGKLMSLSIPNQDLSVWTPSPSDMKTLFSGNYPFTASPDAAKDTQGSVWVFSGSGKYYGDLDEADTSPQIFFGMIDTGNQIGESSLSSTATKTTGAVQGTAKACVYNSTSKSFALQDVVTSITTSSSPSAATVGWKISLAGGERVITRPLAVGGLVDFLTYKPDADPCRYGGDSFLYAVGYTTGLAPSKVAILAPGATSGTSGSNVEVYKGIHLGPGAPPTGEAIIVPPPVEGVETLKKKIQVATGVIVEAENQPVFSVVSKIIHRLKK